MPLDVPTTHKSVLLRSMIAAAPEFSRRETLSRIFSGPGVRRARVGTEGESWMSTHRASLDSRDNLSSLCALLRQRFLKGAPSRCETKLE